MSSTPVLLEEYSTVTAKGQTTIPKSVRQALGVEAGDQIAFRLGAGGVTVHRVDDQQGDPAVGAFLKFLAEDLKDNPARLRELTPEMVSRMTALVDGVEVDPDVAIDGETAL
jgi:antitoxin PrlF